MGYRLREATLDDVEALRGLIARSARSLCAADYSSEAIEGALQSAFGVDTSLIRDRTYYVIEADGGEIVACGGWGRRRTLFGSDARAERDDSRLDPATEPARIRAMFVDPAHARHGLGRKILEHSEQAAIREGFRALELVATLSGVRLYEKHGYAGGAVISHLLDNGVLIRFLPMRKVVVAPA